MIYINEIFQGVQNNIQTLSTLTREIQTRKITLQLLMVICTMLKGHLWTSFSQELSLGRFEVQVFMGVQLTSFSTVTLLA